MGYARGQCACAVVGVRVVQKVNHLPGAFREGYSESGVEPLPDTGPCPHMLADGFGPTTASDVIHCMFRLSVKGEGLGSREGGLINLLDELMEPVISLT